MEPNRKHIDEFLSEQLSDQPMIAEGIGWDSFDKKRNKKRKAFWLMWISLATLWIAGAVFWAHQRLEVSTKSADQNTENQSYQSKEILPDTTSFVDAKVDSPSPSNPINKSFESTEHKSDNYAPPPKTEQKKNSISDTISSEIFDFPSFLISAKPVNFNAGFYSYLQNIKMVRDTSKMQFVNDFYIKDVQKNGDWLVQINAGPMVVNPKLVVNSIGQNRVHKSYSNIRNSSEVGALGFEFSASIAKDMKRFQPFFGIGVSRINVLANYHFTYSEFPILDLNGTILGYQNNTPKQVSLNSNQSYTSIDIPFGVEIDLKDYKNWNFKLHQSFTPRILVGMKGETPNAVFLDNRTSINSGSVRSQNMNYQSGITCSRFTGNNNYWFVQPYFVKSFGLQNTLGLYKTNLNSFGLNFGWKKKLAF